MYKKKIASIVATTAFLFLQPAFTLAADCSTDANKCSIFELCDAAVEYTSGKPMWSTRAKDQKYVEAAKNWIKSLPIQIVESLILVTCPLP